MLTHTVLLKGRASTYLRLLMWVVLCILHAVFLEMGFCQIRNIFIDYHCFNESFNDLTMREGTWDWIICFRCQNDVTGPSLRDGPLTYLHHVTGCTRYNFPVFYFPFLCSLYVLYQFKSVISIPLNHSKREMNRLAAILHMCKAHGLCFFGSSVVLVLCQAS